MFMVVTEWTAAITIVVLYCSWGAVGRLLTHNTMGNSNNVILRVVVVVVGNGQQLMGSESMELPNAMNEQLASAKQVF